MPEQKSSLPCNVVVPSCLTYSLADSKNIASEDILNPQKLAGSSDFSTPPKFTIAPKFQISPDAPWLAPLAGWSDLPFRLLCREEGAKVTCTEMISAKGLVYGGKNTEDLLASSEADSPVVAQIFGAEYDFMEKGIGILQEKGFQHFDVNIGCSVTKVVKTGAGAAMLRDIPNLLKVAEHVITQAHGQVHKPSIIHQEKTGKIGFKIRLGYEMGNDVYIDLAKELEKLGADWITLHPRYAKQAFSGVPKEGALATLKNAVKIPVIASGDLFSAQDGVRVLLETGVDAVMYARGAMSNPFIFNEHAALWKHVQENKLSAAQVPTIAEILPKSEAELREDLGKLIARHLSYAKEFNPHRTLLQMRTIVPRYVKRLGNAKALRLSLIGCRSYEELYALLDEYFG